MIQKFRNKRIAIVGGGLGGLCLAQGLKKNGISYMIFEKDTASNVRTQGYRIRINELGRNALKECLPENLYQLFFETCATSTTGMRVFNPGLKESKNELVESWSDGVKEMPDLKPNRLTLREILLQGLQENIQFGKELVSWKELANEKTELSFADGAQYVADLVVAADGVHSKIGKGYCKDRKINTGNITIYGRTFFTDKAQEQIAKELQKGTSVILGDQFSLITDAMKFDFYKKDKSWDVLSPIYNYFYWAFIGNPEAFGLSQANFYNQPSEEVFQCINKLTGHWHPKLKALFEHADKESLSITPIRSSLPKEKWKSGSITALGDAVHTMSPAGGVGANTAFMDAALLTINISEALVKNTNMIMAIADYEEKMRIYSNQAVELSLRGGNILHGANEKN